MYIKIIDRIQSCQVVPSVYIISYKFSLLNVRMVSFPSEVNPMSSNRKKNLRISMEKCLIVLIWFLQYFLPWYQCCVHSISFCLCFRSFGYWGNVRPFTFPLTLYCESFLRDCRNYNNQFSVTHSLMNSFKEQNRSVRHLFCKQVRLHCAVIFVFIPSNLQVARFNGQ